MAIASEWAWVKRLNVRKAEEDDHIREEVKFHPGWKPDYSEVTWINKPAKLDSQPFKQL